MNLASQVPSSTAAGDIKLLIDTDGDFGNGGTTIIDVSGYDAATQVVTFDNVSFNEWRLLHAGNRSHQPGAWWVLPETCSPGTGQIKASMPPALL